MATDWDPLDDIFPEQTAKNARAGVKFQPRAKKGPKKQSSAPAPYTQPVQPPNSSGDGSANLVDQSLASSDLPDTEKQVENNSDIISRIHSSDDSMLANSATGHFKIGETQTDNDGLSSDSAMPIVGGDLHFDTGKSSAEVTDIFIGLDYPESTNANVGTANRSPDNTHPDVSVTADPLISDEAVISNSDSGFLDVNRGLEIERAEANYSVETLDNNDDVTSLAGQRSGKFQPKPKIHTDREKPAHITSLSNGTETTQIFQDEQSICYESEIMNEGSIPLDTALNSQSLIASDSAFELPGDEMGNFVDGSLAVAFTPEEQLDSFPEIVEEISGSTICGKRGPPMGSNNSLDQQIACVSGANDGARRSLRKRSSSYNLIDESDGEANEDMDTYECPIGDLTNEDGNDDNAVEDAPQKEKPVRKRKANTTLNKKARTKSNKDAPQKEKPVRKRKKVNAVEDQPSKEPPKKRFPHSTRRKRRQVDKALLETPEEDIDLSKLPIRDIILLAEHRERMMSKEKVPEAPSITQSAGPSSFFEHNEDEAFATEEGDYFGYDQPDPVVQERSHTNYQSFMNKTPRSRWTKQDTELFYEAVEQFGSDISMIQQLFPGRTRAQVKFKYKKEERQNPLRLHDALTGRREDHSHFQVVIERLKELAAQDKQNSFKEDSIGLSGGEEEVNHENNDEVRNPKKVIEEEVEEIEAVEPDVVAGIQSPVKTYDSEDEMSKWDDYTSFD